MSKKEFVSVMVVAAVALLAISIIIFGYDIQTTGGAIDSPLFNNPLPQLDIEQGDTCDTPGKIIMGETCYLCAPYFLQDGYYWSETDCERVFVRCARRCALNYNSPGQYSDLLNCVDRCEVETTV